MLNTDTASFRIRGFEDERAGGGANKIRHRERQPNKIWHARCVDQWVRKSRGEGEQGELL